MADKWPLANGNWSNAANWNDGTKPQPGDDVYADGKTVTVDEGATVASVRTTQRSGGTAGGGFTLAAGITLRATVIAGTTACVTVSHSGASSIVVGNVTGGSVTGAFGVLKSGSSEIQITGNLTGGASGHGLNSSGGNVTIIGDVTGGAGSSAYGFYISAAAAVVTIQGDVTGGSGSQAAGLYMNNANRVSVTGNVAGGSGGSGIAGAIACPHTIVGDVTGGSGASCHGVSIGSSTLDVIGDVTAGYGANAHGVVATGTVVNVYGTIRANEFGAVLGPSVAFAIFSSGHSTVVVVDHAALGSNGAWPVSGDCLFRDLSVATLGIRDASLTAGTLVSASSVNNPPATTDVRAGVSYTTGGVLTGTLAVPAAGSVALGVPVDAGVGTAVLTQAAVEAGTAAATLAIRNDIANIDWTARALLTGTVGTVTSNSDFTLLSDDLSATDNQYKNCWLVFETGNNVGVARFIGAYTGSTKRVQFNGGGFGRGEFPSDVVAGDQWRLLPTTDLVAGIVGVRAT